MPNNTLIFDTEIKASYQFSEYEFSSAAFFNNELLIANQIGLCVSEGQLDISTKISSMFELPMSDFGYNRPKKLRSLFLLGSINGKLKITYFSKRESRHVYTEKIITTTGCRIPLDSSLKSTYFGFKIESVSGAVFEIDSIDINYIKTN